MKTFFSFFLQAISLAALYVLPLNCYLSWAATKKTVSAVMWEKGRLFFNEFVEPLISGLALAFVSSLLFQFVLLVLNRIYHPCNKTIRFYGIMWNCMWNCLLVSFVFSLLFVSCASMIIDDNQSELLSFKEITLVMILFAAGLFYWGVKLFVSSRNIASATRLVLESEKPSTGSSASEKKA